MPGYYCDQVIPCSDEMLRQALALVRAVLAKQSTGAPK